MYYNSSVLESCSFPMYELWWYTLYRRNKCVLQDKENLLVDWLSLLNGYRQNAAVWPRIDVIHSEDSLKLFLKVKEARLHENVNFD